MERLWCITVECPDCKFENDAEEWTIEGEVVEVSAVCSCGKILRELTTRSEIKLLCIEAAKLPTKDMDLQRWSSLGNVQ